jgi:hypothetical protein
LFAAHTRPSLIIQIVMSTPNEEKAKSELDLYVDEGRIPKLKEFDILGYWKISGIRYPTLRMIARDIFAIPVTTVASESAFSTSGRVLSDHRSRLTPKTLEVLMCAQNWLRVGQAKGTNNTSLKLLYVVVTCMF